MRNSYVDILKGVTILAVIAIHSLTSFYPTPYGADIVSFLFRVAENTLRFAVPMFVAISGYVLTQSQIKKPLGFGQFISKRIGNLIPLYLLWTAAITAIFLLYPGWNNSFVYKTWWKIVFLGRVDYQFYYVPMLIGLYLLFPLLFRLMKQRVQLTIPVIFTIQVLVYFYIKFGAHPSWFHYDQQYYMLPFSWIFYFVLGMWFGLNRTISPVLRWFACALLLTGLLLNVYEGERLVHSGANIVDALLTTRFTIMLYCTGLITFLFTFIHSFKSRASGFILFAVLGQWSFVLFLCHTLAIRFIQEFINPGSI